MATHSSILAWRIPWTEEPGGLHSMGFQELDTTQWLNNSKNYNLLVFFFFFLGIWTDAYAFFFSKVGFFCTSCFQTQFLYMWNCVSLTFFLGKGFDPFPYTLGSDMWCWQQRWGIMGKLTGPPITGQQTSWPPGALRRSNTRGPGL